MCAGCARVCVEWLECVSTCECASECVSVCVCVFNSQCVRVGDSPQTLSPLPTGRGAGGVEGGGAGVVACLAETLSLPFPFLLLLRAVFT